MSDEPYRPKEVKLRMQNSKSYDAMRMEDAGSVQLRHEAMLRDEFAMRAPVLPEWFDRKKWTTLEDNPNFVEKVSVKNWETNLDWQTRWAYVWADAMIKARRPESQK